MADSSPPTRCVPGFTADTRPSSHEVPLRSGRLPNSRRGEPGLKRFHTPRKVGQFGTYRRQLLIRAGSGRFVALGDTREVIVREAQSTRDVSQRRAGALLFPTALDLAQRGHGHARSFGKFALCDATFGHPVVYDLRDIGPVSQVGNLRTSSDQRFFTASDRQRIDVTLHTTPTDSALDGAINSAYCSRTSSAQPRRLITQMGREQDTWTRRVDGRPETAADTRFFDLRESGYDGPIDQNGYKVTTGRATEILAAMRRRCR
jgi:hypothetical protein